MFRCNGSKSKAAAPPAIHSDPQIKVSFHLNSASSWDSVQQTVMLIKHKHSNLDQKKKKTSWKCFLVCRHCQRASVSNVHSIMLNAEWMVKNKKCWLQWFDTKTIMAHGMLNNEENTQSCEVSCHAEEDGSAHNLSSSSPQRVRNQSELSSSSAPYSFKHTSLDHAFSLSETVKCLSQSVNTQLDKLNCLKKMVCWRIKVVE